MVIQPNMTPKSIVLIWPETEDIFEQFKLETKDRPLEELCNNILLAKLLQTLNETIGSSSATCIEGG
ncbi:hypothetical protein [Alkalihalobacillus sp. AL-G]|uniref:hypothetical protein n=1 Tax=Alkalihalobacillus sp. AL-G TaxID=2926399 RepID=UPI00272B706B|nr:hypothetical protein [Alkalihalobacillus sp. AL-G]WLD93329.1 hypothetical protein MOJ78_20435 [Alkalihalobacillus sp. AL-G]